MQRRRQPLRIVRHSANNRRRNVSRRALCVVLSDGASLQPSESNNRGYIPPFRRNSAEILSFLLFFLTTCNARALRQSVHVPGSSSWAPRFFMTPPCCDSFTPTQRRRETMRNRGERDHGSARRDIGVLSGGMWMKANKKSKKKKAGQSGDKEGAAAPAPQRVTKDAPISVRAQIKYAKIKKSMEKAHSTSTKKVTNSYRRVKSLDYEEIVEPEDLSKVYMPDISPALMVDGYNIIYHWNKCCVVAENGNLEEARRILVDELDTLSAMRGWSVTVVFDAYKRKGGTRQSYTTPNKIEVIFTEEGESADMYVERQTMELKDSGCPSIMVATGDKLMQSLVLGAGAEVYSPDRIIEEIEICRREVTWYTEMYLKKKEKMIEASHLRNPVSSVRYVDTKARHKSRGKRNGGGQGTGGGGRTFNIEDDL